MRRSAVVSIKRRTMRQNGRTVVPLSGGGEVAVVIVVGHDCVVEMCTTRLMD